MKHAVKNLSRRSGIALAVLAALSVFGTGTALAQTFNKADLSIAPRTNEAQEIEAGGLTCKWQETDLGPYQLVNYNCGAQAVGVLEGCVYKNKLISDTELSIFKDVMGGEHGEGIAFISNNSGRINGSTTTAIPESHGGGGEELCPEIGETGGEGGQQPEVEVVAVRWCNASLTDITNNLVGVTANELYEELVHGFTGTVPSCAELLASSPTP